MNLKTSLTSLKVLSASVDSCTCLYVKKDIHAHFESTDKLHLNSRSISVIMLKGKLLLQLPLHHHVFSSCKNPGEPGVMTSVASESENLCVPLLLISATDNSKKNILTFIFRVLYFQLYKLM